MKNTKKNLLIHIQKYNFGESDILDCNLEKYLQDGATSLLRFKTNFLTEIYQCKIKLSKEVQYSEDQDQQSIQSKQDLDSITACCFKNNTYFIEYDNKEHAQGDFTDFKKLLFEENKELLMLIIGSPQLFDQNLVNFIDDFLENTKESNLSFVLSPPDHQKLNIQDFQKKRIQQSIDNKDLSKEFSELVPIQSFEYNKYHQVDVEFETNYAYLIQTNNSDHRRDLNNKLIEFIELNNPVLISGNIINIENFWKETLFSNSKYPKFGA